MIIYLDYYKAKLVDRDEFLKTYSSSTGGYKLLRGAPLLVNVDGSYVKCMDIPELITNRNQRVLSAVNRWLTDLRMPSNVTDGEILNFRWKK